MVKKGSKFVPAPAEGIEYGDIFVVEVKFTETPAESTFLVELNWEDASVPFEVALERADNTDTLYRSRQMRVAFDIKPKVELADDPEGSNDD